MIFIFFLNLKFISTEHDSISSSKLPEITIGEIAEEYPDNFYEDYSQDLPENFPALHPALLPGFFTEINPEDFAETLVEDFLDESPGDVTEIFSDDDAEDFYDGGDWWNDYYNDIIFTYFDDYNYISREIHDRILKFNSNEGLDIYRAGSNDTLNINFQLFIKDVTNLQQAVLNKVIVSKR